ncbi:MAG: hypothetical protein JW973_10610 [Bacteroidales bacterium]|nr:hypothetical protein [Bacteroidales bacterium]
MFTLNTFVKVWILLLVGVATQQIVTCQPFTVSVSKPDFNQGGTSVHKIIGHDTGSYYVLKHHSGQYYLEKLDGDLKFIRDEPIKLYEGLKTYDLDTVVHFHGTLYLFVSRRKFSESVLYYQEIDKETLLPVTGFVELTSVRFIKGNWPDIYFALSRQETKLMIACRIKLNWEKIQHNEFYVFDKGMELLWKRKDFFDFSGQGPRKNYYLVDEQGNVSILSLTKRESIISLFQDVKNSYTIHRYTQEGKAFREYPLILENRYIRGVMILGNERGELICAGLYSELFRAGVGGTFFFKIDPVDGIVYYNQSQAFSDELLSHLRDIKEPIMAEEELIEYRLTDLVLRKNGHIILIAEQLFEQTYNTYNNLIVSCFDTTGHVYWTQVIPKQQDFDIRQLIRYENEVGDYRRFVHETGAIDDYIENYCSYALIASLNESAITILYNDNIKNLRPGAKQKSFNSPRRSYLAAVRINESGVLSRYEVWRWKRKALYPVPMRYYDTLGETVIIPAFKGRKYYYLKITANY